MSLVSFLLKPNKTDSVRGCFSIRTKQQMVLVLRAASREEVQMKLLWPFESKQVLLPLSPTFTGLSRLIPSKVGPNKFFRSNAKLKTATTKGVIVGTSIAWLTCRL